MLKLQFVKRDGWIEVVEGDKVINNITVFNTYMAYDFIIDQLDYLYQEKNRIENVMLAIRNKYTMKKIIGMQDIECLEELLKGWIIDDAKTNIIQYIKKEIQREDYTSAYHYVMNMYYGLKSSKIKMDMNNFYLLESYV